MTMVQVPEGTTVLTQGKHYFQYKVGRADQRRSFKLLSGWFRQFLLDLASLKTLLASSICGVVKDSFSTKSESMKSASSFLPMSSALIRSVAMTGLRSHVQRFQCKQLFILRADPRLYRS